MKKYIFTAITIFFTLTLFSQSRIQNNDINTAFEKGKKFFLEENYLAAREQLTEYKKRGKDASFIEEADYMLAVSEYNQGKKRSEEMLKEFLDTYPESIYQEDTRVLIGSHHFEYEEWRKALYWFKQVKSEHISDKYVDDYFFRLAYSHLKIEEYGEAKFFFEQLVINSKKYRAVSKFYLATILFSDKEYDKSVEIFKQLENDDTFGEASTFYLSQYYFISDNCDMMSSYAQKLRKKKPSSKYIAELDRMEGNCIFRKGDYAKAITFYNSYFDSTSSPQREDAYNMGIALMQTGRYRDAATKFSLAIGIDDALTQSAYLMLGHCYLKSGEKRQAQMAYESATRTNFNPEVSEVASYNYALLLHQTNVSMFGESVTLFERFLNEFPSSKYRKEVNSLLAEIFLASTDYQVALDAIKRMKNRDNSILKAKQIITFKIAVDMFINNNLNEAISTLGKVIAMGEYDKKSYSEAYYWRGEAHYRQKDYKKAANDFTLFTQKASTSFDNYSTGWYNLGYSLFNLNSYKKSIEAFKKYASVATSNDSKTVADAYNRIGDAYFLNRNFDEAERYYSLSEKTDPTNGDYACYQRAFVMGLTHKYSAKIKTLNELMRKYPNSEYIDASIYEKSRAFVMLNREDEAINELESLINKYPQSAYIKQAGIQLGQLHYNRRKYTQAISAYKSVIKSTPRSSEAQNAIKSLETIYKEINDIDSYVKYVNNLGGAKISASKQDSLTYLAAEDIYLRGDKDDAIVSLGKYLKSYPKGGYSDHANYYSALIHLDKGNTPQAKYHFREVIDSRSDKFLENSLISLAEMEYKEENYNEAYDYFQQLTQISTSASNKNNSYLGMARSAVKMNRDEDVVQLVTQLLKEDKLSSAIENEVKYYRAKALISIGNKTSAIDDLKDLSKDPRSIYGSEAQYLIADELFEQGEYDKTIEHVNSFMKAGTPHRYWLARSLIILSDAYAMKGDKFQAKQYLESLKNNYKGDESDIKRMIDERMNSLQVEEQ